MFDMVFVFFAGFRDIFNGIDQGVNCDQSDDCHNYPIPFAVGPSSVCESLCQFRLLQLACVTGKCKIATRTKTSPSILTKFFILI